MSGAERPGWGEWRWAGCRRDLHERGGAEAGWPTSTTGTNGGAPAVVDSGQELRERALECVARSASCNWKGRDE